MAIELRNSVCKSVLSILLIGWALTTNAGNGRGLQEQSRIDWVENSLQVVQKQAEKMTELVLDSARLPRSIQHGLVPARDWTSGFFPGMLWYLYQYTGADSWKKRAQQVTELLRDEQYNATDHDIGFRMYCSYGNGWLLTGDKAYKQVIVRSAKTLSSRYTHKTGAIMSWEPDTLRDWHYPVIIDNMMNLELMMEAYKLSGDTVLKHIAIAHADKTMQHQYRSDYSCPHVVDYDAETGALRKFDWNNGLDKPQQSTWARGQAWGLYGFTMMYRQTRNPKYLRHAEHIADFLLNHPNLPADGVPYWDYAGVHLSQMRDASAAALMASALMELSTYSAAKKTYFEAGEKMLKSLSSPEYLAKPGEHHYYSIKHATGNFLRNSELDGALSYADYYYVEGLLRYHKLVNGLKLYADDTI